MINYDTTPIQRRIRVQGETEVENISLSSDEVLQVFGKFDSDKQMVDLRDQYISLILNNNEDVTFANELDELARPYVVEVTEADEKYAYSFLGNLTVRWIDHHLTHQRKDSQSG